MPRFVLPVKSLRTGKSRLHIAQVPTPKLISSMLLDTIETVLGTDLGEVVVVTPDESVRGLVAGMDVAVLIHHGDLNTAVGAALKPERCVALLPDVPAATSDEIRQVLGHESGFVPDRSGTGTTMAFGPGLRPRFGAGSAQRYEHDGLQRFALPGSGLGVDIDTAEDLRIAMALGLGRHTRAALNSAGTGPP